MTTVSTIYVGSSSQDQVVELYYAALGRKPSGAELDYYSTMLASGVSVTQIATDFLASPEFASLYGSNPSNAQYVTALYQNVLHRAPSASEVAYYTNVLTSSESRLQVLFNFINSPENQQNLASQLIAPGAIDTDTASSSVNVIASGSTALDVAMAAANATNITVTGGAHLTLDMFNSNYASLTSLTIANTGGVTAYLYNAPKLTSIDASQSSGSNILSLSAGESYTGGSGQSVIILTADDTATKIYGGTASNNELVLAGAKFTLAGTGTETSGFSVAGFNTLSTAGAYDVSGDAATILKGVTTVDLQNTMAVATLFTVAQNTSLAIDDGSTSAVVFQSIDKSGASDSMTLTLNGGASTLSLTLEDSASTPVGIGTVNLVTNGGANTIATLADTSLSTLNVTGSGSVTIGLAAFTDDTVASFAVSNTSGGLLSFRTFTDDSLTTLNFTGNQQTELWAFTDTISSTLTVTDSASANVYFHSLATTSAPTITFTNSGSALLVVGDVDAFTAGSLTSLTLNGAVNFNMTSDSATSGTTIAGGTDNANVSVTIAGTASGDTDNITLGNGNDYVKVAGSGTENITLGNGANTIDLTGSTATDNVVVGSGVTVITLGDGGSVEHVSFGSHTGGNEAVTLTNANGSFGSNTSTSATSVSTSGLYVLNGMKAGDAIALPVANDGLVLATNLAGGNGEVMVAHGTYNAASSTFTYSASGADTLLTYDAINSSAGHPLVSVVLAGFNYSSAITEAYNGVITLG
jgi:hypothetical protein